MTTANDAAQRAVDAFLDLSSEKERDRDELAGDMASNADRADGIGKACMSYLADALRFEAEHEVIADACDTLTHGVDDTDDVVMDVTLEQLADRLTGIAFALDAEARAADDRAAEPIRGIEDAIRAEQDLAIAAFSRELMALALGHAGAIRAALGALVAA